MSNRTRIILAVAIVLTLGTGSAAALGAADHGRSDTPGDAGERAGGHDGTPPGDEKRPPHAGGPGSGDDQGPDDAGLPSLAPMDHIAQAPALSQPEFDHLTRDAIEIPTHDGETIYVEIVRPNPARYPGLQLPVILESAPYHGTLADRDGTRIFPDPVDEEGNPIGLTGYFAPAATRWR